MSERPTPHPRRYQFSLRTLFILTTIVAVISWGAVKLSDDPALQVLFVTASIALIIMVGHAIIARKRGTTVKKREPIWQSAALALSMRAVFTIVLWLDRSPDDVVERHHAARFMIFVAVFAVARLLGRFIDRWKTQSDRT